MEYRRESNRTDSQACWNLNLARESEVIGIGLRLEPEIAMRFRLIYQLPGRKLRDATDARGHGLKEAVEDGGGQASTTAAKDFIGVKQ